MMHADPAVGELNRHVAAALCLVEASSEMWAGTILRLQALSRDAGDGPGTGSKRLLEDWCLPFLVPAYEAGDVVVCRLALGAMFDGLAF